MCDIDTAIASIRDYTNEHFFNPSPSWDKNELKKRSYQRWAAYEICNRIMDSPFEDPIRVINRFMVEMIMYTCYGEDKPCNFIFETAVETAEELVLLFV